MAVNNLGREMFVEISWSQQVCFFLFVFPLFSPPASYLPQPGAVRYEFRYVDKVGQVCARSPPFTFCLPKPLEELETLKEEEDEEDGEEELLLVVPRAQLLQVRTESWCLAICA